MPLLKLDKDDPKTELEFEVRCALRQDPSERLDRWLEWNLQLLHFAEQQRKALHGHEEAPSLTKRT
jgi:hypothetical protein